MNRTHTPIFSLRTRKGDTLVWQGYAWTGAQARLLALADAATATAMGHLIMLPPEEELKCYRVS